MLAIEYRIIGWIASVFSIINLMPQAMQTLLNQSSNGFSLVSMAALFFGNIFWVGYGFLVKSYPVIIAAVAKLLAVFIIFYFRFKEWSHARRILKAL